jgi:hypothetical protein
MLCDTFVNQQVIRIAAKKYEKSVSGVWWVCGKALPLHPQSREIRGKLEMVKTKMRFETHFKKNFFLKKTSKSFGGFKNSPYLCIRFFEEST